MIKKWYEGKVCRIPSAKPHKYPNKQQQTKGATIDDIIDIARYTLSDFEDSDFQNVTCDILLICSFMIMFLEVRNSFFHISFNQFIFFHISFSSLPQTLTCLLHTLRIVPSLHFAMPNFCECTLPF